MKYVKRFCPLWIGASLAYWWMLAKTEVQQLAAALIIGLAVSFAIVTLAGSAKLSFRVKWNWLLLLLRRLPAAIFRDIGLLAAALWRSIFAAAGVGTRTDSFGPTGAFSKVKFDLGGTGPGSVAWRALVFAGVSLAPNTIAISVVEKHRLLLHQLVFRSEEKSEEWPI